MEQVLDHAEPTASHKTEEDTKKINIALYDKLSSELHQYKEWLLQQSPGVILYDSPEYAIKQDILLALEYNNISYSQAKALLESPTPLQDVYNYYNGFAANYMKEILESIKDCADEKLAEHKQ